MVRADPVCQLALPHVLRAPSHDDPLAPWRPTLVPPRAAPDAVTRELLRRGVERRVVLAAGAPLVVRVTDNRRTMLSVSRRAAVRVVRMHHMFLDAPGDVLDAVARYLAHNDPRACPAIDRYIAANRHRIRDARDEAAERLRTRGRVHDLAALRDELAARYFPEGIGVAITWGRDATGLRRRGRGRGRRTLRMGSYHADRALIRVHPALDQAWVPRYFVESVVYHEMLHHVVPMPLVGGKRRLHSPEFRARERLFHDHERARAWEREHLRALIASRDR